VNTGKKDLTVTSQRIVEPPPPPPQSSWELFVDWFWEGLHPLLCGLVLVAVAGVGWLIAKAKPPPILAGPPRVAVKLRKADPATRFDVSGHAVRDMLTVNVEMQPSPPTIHPSVSVTEVRTLP
jgi:hypothetical protein